MKLPIGVMLLAVKSSATRDYLGLPSKARLRGGIPSKNMVLDSAYQDFHNEVFYPSRELSEPTCDGASGLIVEGSVDAGKDCCISQGGSDSNNNLDGYLFTLDAVEVEDDTGNWMDADNYDGNFPVTARYTVKFKDDRIRPETGSISDLSHWNSLFDSSCKITSTDLISCQVLLDNNDLYQPASENSEGNSCETSDLTVAKCDTDREGDKSGSMQVIIERVYDLTGGAIIPQAKPGNGCSDLSCILTGPSCTPPSAVCGNNILEAGEVCEIENEPTCYNCQGYCGDGVVDTSQGETCDCDEDGNCEYVNGDPSGPNYCRDDCTYCGDGNMDSDEQCDGTEGCSQECTFTLNPGPGPGPGPDPGTGPDCTCTNDGLSPRAVQFYNGVDPIGSLEDLNLTCSSHINHQENGLVITAKDCRDETVQVSNVPVIDPVIFDECEVSSITQTWTTSDGPCHDTATISRQVNILKQEPTFITTPVDRTISCDGEYTQNNLPATVQAKDRCGILFEFTEEDSSVVSINNNIFSNACSQQGQWKRSWTAKDSCNITNTFEQTITVEDTTAPTITVTNPTGPIECVAVGDDEWFNGILTEYAATAEDSCDSSVGATSISTEVSNNLNGCSGTGVYTREFTVTDECGNSATKMQTITIVDTTAPTITVTNPTGPIECVAAGDDEWFNGILTEYAATAVDTCDSSVGATSIISTEVSNNLNGCSGTGDYTREFTVTDECGNSATPEPQTITIVDTTAPILSDVPEGPTQVTCLDIIPIADVTASDACDGDLAPDKISFEDSYNPISGGSKTTRTWKATDCSGLTDEKSEDIYVMDRCIFNIDQAFSGTPININFDITNIFNTATESVTGLQISIKQEGDNYGDIRGVFLNFADNQATNAILMALSNDNTGLTATSKIDNVDVNFIGEIKIEKDNVDKVTNDVTMRGGGRDAHVYDMGMEIGTRGIGQDDIREVTILIPGMTTDDLLGEIGVRLTSVGTKQINHPNSRESSSKTYGTFSCPCGGEGGDISRV